jgi:hypothetical protein
VRGREMKEGTTGGGNRVSSAGGQGGLAEVLQAGTQSVAAYANLGQDLGQSSYSSYFALSSLFYLPLLLSTLHFLLSSLISIYSPFECAVKMEDCQTVKLAKSDGSTSLRLSTAVPTIRTNHITALRPSHSFQRLPLHIALASRPRDRVRFLSQCKSDFSLSGDADCRGDLKEYLHMFNIVFI